MAKKQPNKKDVGDLTVLFKFKRDKNGGHNHAIMDDIDDCHVSVGITSDSKKGKNQTNYRLEKSPFNDGRQSFLRRSGEVNPKNKYISPKIGVMTEKDYNKAKAYADKAKEKYIKKQQHSAKHSK